MQVAGVKNRTEAAKGSLSSGAASWGHGPRGTAPGQDAEGAEPPQQSFGLAFHGLGGSSGKVTAHGLQQAVEVNAGVTEVDMGEDARQAAEERARASASAVGPRPRVTS